MKTLITIMAHAAAEDTFTRHYPFWEAHEKEGAELLFIFPEGQAIRGLGKPSLEIGKAEHDGIQAMMRFRSVLMHLASLTEIERHVFLEYDSFILGPLPTLFTSIAGNIFSENSPAWRGRSFIHPPFMVEANALRKVVAEFNKLPMGVENGMWDRALGLASEMANITRLSWIENGYGYSQNTIHPEHFEACTQAILNGAHALHGVKDEACLKVITEAWKLRKNIDELELAGWKVSRV